MASVDDLSRVSRRTKIALYLAVWLAALIATNPNATLWSLVWMFPIGLLRTFYPASLRGGGWWQLLSCFAVYALHAFFYFRAQTRLRTTLWFLVLVALLLCNVSGCREMINTH